MYEPMPKEGTPLDSAISEMDVLAETPELKVLAENAKKSLEEVKAKLGSGEIDSATACDFLFNLYVRLQDKNSGTEIGHILRVVGDDLGYQLGVDDDELWDMYQKSLERSRIEKFGEQDISPMKSFYDGLSKEERLALAEVEGWQGLFGEETVAVATLDMSEVSYDDLVEKYDRITLLKLTTESGITKTFSFIHNYAIDLTKLKPVEYGMSEALVGEWSMLEWMRAKDTAVAQALDILDERNRKNIKVEFAQIGFGYQVSF
ncbi:MAG TPA: hypothetical protein VIM31_01080 [Candidatus Microsaccharimonas sp.]|jgi:hypothetical protein